MKAIDVGDLVNEIKELCNTCCPYTEKHRDVMCKACAISYVFDILDRMPSVQLELIEDTVSRQAAIDVVVKRYDEYGRTAKCEELASAIEKLPSAQPELIAQGAYVRGFEQGRTQGMLDVKLQQTCNKLATDCISRQAAIDAADSIINRDTSGNNDVVKAMTAWKEHIKGLPSAQPEPQWIPCSERLPKPFEFCLWTTTDGRVVYHHCDGMFSKYTAWMPLPEPYKGEQ